MRTLDDHTPDPERGIVLVELGSPGYPAFGWNAYGLECLKGHLQGRLGERCPPVEIVRVHGDGAVERLALRLAASPPALLGLSLPPGSLPTLDRLLAAWIRRAGPAARCRVLVAAGNQLATYEPEAVLRTILSAAPAGRPAVAVVGEGEAPMLGLVRHLAGEGALEEVPGLVLARRAGEAPRATDLAGGREPLDLPASFDTVPAALAAGYPTAMLQTSRGCFWGRCAYCTRTSFRNPAAALRPELLEGAGLRRWQPLPRRRVEAELERLVALGVTSFELADDELVGGRSAASLDRCRWLAGLFRRLRRESGRRLSFRCFTRPDVVYRPGDPAGNRRVAAALAGLARAGLSRVYLGVEAGCPETLRFYNRATPRATIEGAVRTVRALGLELDAGFILFHPYQTPRGILEEVAFFEANRLLEANQWPFRPLVVNRGSLLEHRLRDSGLLLPRRREDVNFLRLPWRFADPRTAVLHAAVEEVARREREIMYAVKVISKKDNGPAADGERALCERLLRRHGAVYLRLLRRLATEMLEARGTAARLRPAMAAAAREVDALVAEVATAVAEGRIRDRDGSLGERLERFLAA